jgi:excinuclease ABC subunit C
LQRLRDEAHRFAITYHRSKRSKSMTVSALDKVPGLGDTRRKALVRHFGSVAALRRAGVEEIVQVPGVGRRTADAVVAALAGAIALPRGEDGPQIPIPSTSTPRQ